MKALIIKSKKIKNTETFILDHYKTDENTNIIISGKYPIFGWVNYANNLEKLMGYLDFKYPKLYSNIYNSILQYRLMKNKPDVILAEYGITGVKVQRFCKKNDIPLVIHFHGYDAHNINIINKYKHDYKQIFKTCTSVIVVSNLMRQQVIKLGADPNKTFVNPCGVKTNNIKFCQNDDINKSNTFLTVGRFVDKKAPHLTILAFNEALKYNTNIKLKMIGDGPLLGSCQDLAESLKIEKSIQFLGFQDHDSVFEHMKNSFAFVQHSIKAQNGDCEGSPVSVAEASASGLPVISTYHAGIPEIIKDKRTGFLVEEKDYMSMAKYMIKILENEDLTIKMRINGRKHIEDNYSQTMLLKRLNEILNWSSGLANKKPNLIPDFLND